MAAFRSKLPSFLRENQEWENCNSLPDEQNVDFSAEHEAYYEKGSSGDEIESQEDADEIGLG